MNSQQPVQPASLPMNTNPTTPKPTTGTGYNPRPSVSSQKQILSVDLGRTSTKTCVSRDVNGVIFIPANVKHLTIEQVRGGGFESKTTDPLLDMWVEYQNRGYAIGQLAADFGADLGIGQSKIENAVVKVLAAAGYFQIDGDISVVLGLPYLSQEQFEQEKQDLISRLTARHKLTYRGESLSVNIIQVWVMPEGYGSLIWSEAQDKKTALTPDFANLSIAVVDIGHQTTDFLMVDGFRFARGASESINFAMNQFYTKVAERIAEKVDKADPKEISQSLSLLKAVHEPQGERFYRAKGSTKPVNLDEFLPELKKSFAQELSDRLVKWLPERVTDVVVTGGGGEFFWADFQPLLKEAKLKAHLAEHSRKANALGQYIYGEAQMLASANR